jgi:hypothetical protein
MASALLVLALVSRALGGSLNPLHLAPYMVAALDMVTDKPAWGFALDLYLLLCPLAMFKAG